MRNCVLAPLRETFSRRLLKYLTIFLLLFVCFSSCKKKQENILSDIKKKYTEINGKLKDYTCKRVDDLTSKGGGTISGYYRDDEARKIISEHFYDTCRTFTEYYFDDGMLIFVVQQDYVYNKPISYTEEKARANNDSIWYDDKKTQLEVSRFYFNENKLIKWIDGQDYDEPVNTAEFIDKQSQLWAEAAILLKELKEQ